MDFLQREKKPTPRTISLSVALKHAINHLWMLFGEVLSNSEGTSSPVHANLCSHVQYWEPSIRVLGRFFLGCENSWRYDFFLHMDIAKHLGAIKGKNT